VQVVRILMVVLLGSAGFTAQLHGFGLDRMNRIKPPASSRSFIFDLQDGCRQEKQTVPAYETLNASRNAVPFAFQSRSVHSV